VTEQKIFQSPRTPENHMCSHNFQLYLV